MKHVCQKNIYILRILSLTVKNGTDARHEVSAVADEGKNASVGQYRRSVSYASCSMCVYPLLPSFLRRFWKIRAYFGRQIKLSQDRRWVYFRRRQMPTRSSANFSSEYAIYQLRRIWNWTCVMDFIICTIFAVKVKYGYYDICYRFSTLEGQNFRSQIFANISA